MTTSCRPGVRSGSGGVIEGSSQWPEPFLCIEAVTCSVVQSDQRSLDGGSTSCANVLPRGVVVTVQSEKAAGISVTIPASAVVARIMRRMMRKIEAAIGPESLRPEK